MNLKEGLQKIQAWRAERRLSQGQMPPPIDAMPEDEEIVLFDRSKPPIRPTYQTYQLGGESITDLWSQEDPSI